MSTPATFRFHQSLPFPEQIDLSLGRIVQLMDRLKNPQEAFPAVLVGGTNGKGSTCAFLESILRHARYKTAQFVSPHLLDERERTLINGQMASRELFTHALQQARQAADQSPAIHCTFFELFTATALLIFAIHKVDIAIIEVGLGGRKDATNILSPLLSILTNVTMDHQEHLGNTVEAIAQEKLPIARGNRPFISAMDPDLFDQVARPYLEKTKAIYRLAGRDFSIQKQNGTWSYHSPTWHIDDITLSLSGDFQSDNAALAIAAAEALREKGFSIHRDHVHYALGHTTWLGRWQTVHHRPLVILDGGHNHDAGKKIAHILQETPMPRPRVLIHATKPNKDYKSYLQELGPHFEHIIETTTPDLENEQTLATTAKTLFANSTTTVHAAPDIVTAYQMATELTNHQGFILMAGSLYLVAHALHFRPWEG